MCHLFEVEKKEEEETGPTGQWEGTDSEDGVRLDKIRAATMRWFNGNMLEAIAEAHNRRVLLMVFVEGDDLASQNMRATFEDPDVDKLLEAMGSVPIRLRANSNACRQFTLVYPVTASPSTFFISSRGNLEASVVGFVDPAAFRDRLDALTASSNIRKVDSDMRNINDVPGMSVDRMLKLTRQLSGVKLGTTVATGATEQQVPSQLLLDAKRKTDRGARRKKKKQQNVANVQTSIPALTEQATQINLDDMQSYNNLLQKLANMEEASQVPGVVTQATADVHAEIANNYLSLLRADGGASIGGACPLPGIFPGISNAASTGKQESQMKLINANAESESSSNSDGDLENGGPFRKCDDSEYLAPVSVTQKSPSPLLQPPPPPSPPPSLLAATVPTWAPEPSLTAGRPACTEIQPLTYEDMECALEDVLDGHNMLMKFAVLAQEFAEKVLSSSLFEYSEAKSPDASAEATKPLVTEPRKASTGATSSSRSKKVADTTVASSGKHPPATHTPATSSKDKRRTEDAVAKRACQLESLTANVGDAPDAMKQLRDEATSPNDGGSRRRSSSVRSQQKRQQRSANKAETQSKPGSEKRKGKTHREPRESVGDSRRVVAKKPPVAEANDGNGNDVALEPLGKKIKDWESFQTPTQSKVPTEKRVKKTKPQPQPHVAKVVEDDPVEPLVAVEPQTSKEPDMPICRPAIDTIVEEEPCLEGPSQCSPPPALVAELDHEPAPPQPVMPVRAVDDSRALTLNKSKEFLTASNSQVDDFVVIPRKPIPLEETNKPSVAPVIHDHINGAAPVRKNVDQSDGDDETVDEEDAVPSQQPGKGDPDWIEQVIKTESRRALMDRMEDSLQNLLRTMNDVEGHTLSLSNADNNAIVRTDRSKTILKPPTASPSKQHVRVTIHESKEPEKIPATIVAPSPKPGQRISLSGTNVRNRARGKPSSTYLADNNEQTSAHQSNQPSAPRKCASLIPPDHSENGKKRESTNIMLNFPDGSSTRQTFSTGAYLDEVRWHAEELLARTLPSCFPFTMARTNPLREFSREDYRRTLEQLKLAPSATLLILPRSTAQGSCGPGTIRPSTSDPNWVLLLKLMFGVFVVSPITLVWGMLNRQRSPINREAMVTRSRNSSSHLALPAPPTRSGSSGGLRKKLSSHTEDFDLF